MLTMLNTQKSFPPSHHWSSSDLKANLEKRAEKIDCNSYRRSQSVFPYSDIKSERSISPDEIDNPVIEKCSTNDNNLFKIMKLEINRLNSYTGKWPLSYVKPKQLAESGFFYLQSEDEVQCAFCHVIIDDWNVGQKPRKEHMKKSPRCPLIWSPNGSGNVPLPPPQPVEVVSKVNPVSRPAEINFSTYKPKHPRMADLNKRLKTYQDWPLIMLSSRQLAECGLYYTGVSDVVTCFFCGGSLGNWDLNDDPFNEHTKFFPNCSYLSLIKGHMANHHRPTQPSTQLAGLSQAAMPISAYNRIGNSNSLANDIIQQASEIFPPGTVQKVVLKHLKESGRQFSSLADLCDAILEYKEIENSTRIPQDVTGHTTADVCPEPVKTCEYTGTSITAVATEEEPVVKNTKEVKDYLLCKICMDREMGVVFQPCGHLVSCPKCAQVIFNCPLCRTPVTGKVRTYLS